MNKRALYLILGAIVLALAGCGGGGSSVNNTVSGVASKGLIKNGVNNVKIYALKSDGSVGDLLQTTSTDANGAYTASIGSYSGPVLVKVSGTYTDEATGDTVTIPADQPLRAALDKVTGNVSVAVTPLSELAVQTAGTLTADNVKAANAVVSTQFGVNVIEVQPVAPDAATLSSATADQKAYTLALATISKMAAPTDGSAASAGAVSTVIGTLKTDLASNGDTMSQNTKTSFTTALTNYLNDTTHNSTGVTADTAPATLVNVGSKTATVKLGFSGLTGNVYGVDLTLDLPAGVMVAADSTGAVSNAVLTSASGISMAKYTPASGDTPGKIRIALASAQGIGNGDFISIICAVDSGATPSFASTLVESGVKVITDVNGNTSSTSATVTVTAN